MPDIEWVGLRNKATGAGAGHRCAKPQIQNGIQEEKDFGAQVRGESCRWLIEAGARHTCGVWSPSQ